MSGQNSSGPVPSGQVPSGQDSSGKVPSGKVPTEQIPSGRDPSDRDAEDAPDLATSDVAATAALAGRREERREERLGIVSFTNVAPLHWRLAPWDDDQHRIEFVHGVPQQLNQALLAGEIDLTLISSVEYLRHRDRLRALPDFSIATLGPVYSVTLFHWRPWRELHGARIAVTTDSATSVALLDALLRRDGIEAELVPVPTDLPAMMREHDAALLIGDAALREAVDRRPIDGRVPDLTDLGEAWYDRTRLPFTFAVWASPADRRPSDRLVAELRAARGRGLGHLTAVATEAAGRAGVSEAVMLRYLANFRYHLMTPDRDGLAQFGAWAVPGFRAEQLRYWDHDDVASGTDDGADRGEARGADRGKNRGADAPR